MLVPSNCGKPPFFADPPLMRLAWRPLRAMTTPSLPSLWVSVGCRRGPGSGSGSGSISGTGSACVSPAYGFSALALVKCSNKEGPGPRHNMKEDPGTSTLIMKGGHGQEVPCDPGQVTSILGNTSPPLPPPPTRAARTEHPPTPFKRTHPSPSLSTTGGQPRRKHTSASGTRSEAMGWARGG